MSKPVAMPREDRIRRKGDVLEMRRLGLSIPSIVLRTGLKRKRVLDIIAMDLRSKGAIQKEVAHQMWEFDDDARRREIIKRAAEGARATLQMSSSQ